MDEQSKIKTDNSWRGKGLDADMQRPMERGPRQASYIGGAKFDALLDDLLFNRMLRLRDLREIPQGNDPGKIYWDGANKQAKIWIDSTGKWADLIYTSTSTSTSSTSSSSTSTSTTSSSTSSTSSSSTSTT